MTPQQPTFKPFNKAKEDMTLEEIYNLANNAYDSIVTDLGGVIDDE